MPTAYAPRVDHWPQTLRSAALHAGTIVPCGPGLRPASWPDTPTTRAVAIANYLDPRYAASGETAAWIWGACRNPGTPLTFTMTRGRVPIDVPGAQLRLHEHRLEEGELIRLAEFMVTTRLRTAYDLLRSPEVFTQTRQIACRLLIVRENSQAAALEERAARSSKADRGRVVRRLRQLYG